jgi:hypothetical protein
VSPVGKGRKRKPGKGEHETGARYDRSDFARTPPDLHTHELGVGSMAYLDDLSPDTSPADVEDVLDCRVFTMPCADATIDDEEFPELDPADPDERGLLIQGEHSECHEAVTDPVWEGQTARRLREVDMDRHDVLHTLAVMAGHLYFVLAREEQYDADAYRRALNALGRDT